MKRKFFSDDFLRNLESIALLDSYIASNAEVKKELYEPFYAFVEDLLRRAKKCDGSINMSTDELIIEPSALPPYMQHFIDLPGIGAVIKGKNFGSHGPFTGLFFHFDFKKITLAGGAFGTGGNCLEMLNNYIRKQQRKYDILLADEDFSLNFGQITYWESPTGCFKGYTKEISSRFITDDILPDIIISHYKAGKMLNHFYKNGLGAMPQPAYV